VSEAALCRRCTTQAARRPDPIRRSTSCHGARTLSRSSASDPSSGYGCSYATREGLSVNVRAACRILAAKRWFVHQLGVTLRPHVQDRKDVAPLSERRWAIDLSDLYCDADDWWSPGRQSSPASPAKSSAGSHAAGRARSDAGGGRAGAAGPHSRQAVTTSAVSRLVLSCIALGRLSW